MRSRPGCTARSRPAARSSGRKRSTRTSCGRSRSSAELGACDDDDARRPRPARAASPRGARGARAARRADRAAGARRRGALAGRRSRAATATSRRAGSRRRAAASTRSARPATRATPPSRSPSARPTRRCSTTARARFYLARAAQVGRDGVPDVMLGVTAASDEPIAGGRHKVFGHHDLAVIPQTSTIASHLPRAVGRRDRDRPGAQARRRMRRGRTTRSSSAASAMPR